MICLYTGHSCFCNSAEYCQAEAIARAKADHQNESAICTPCATGATRKMHRCNRAACPHKLPTDRAVNNSPPACPDMDQEAPHPDEAAGICLLAGMIVSGDRAVQHGPKERNHQNIADHWNAYLAGRLDHPLSALDVALMMIELKIARTKAGSGRTSRDNYVDMAGYAGVAGEIALGKD